MIDLAAPLRAIAAEALVRACYPVGDYTRRETAPPNVEHWYVAKTEGEFRQEIVHLNEWYPDRAIPFRIGYGPVTDTLVLSPYSPGRDPDFLVDNDLLLALYQRNM